MENTTIRNSQLFCLNCGSAEVIPFPLCADEFNRMCNEFDVKHSSCPKTWEPPKPNLHEGINQRRQWWLMNGETGMSSKCMFYHLSGDPQGYHKNRLAHPCDPDDFKRCYELLNVIPEWKTQLDRLRPLSPEWDALVDNWRKLSEMYRELVRTKKDNGMYKFMQKILASKGHGK